MATIERIMIEEAFENRTHRVLFTPIKEDIYCKNWIAVKKDDLSWWEGRKETQQIWSEKKIRSELRLSKAVVLLEGMVFIKISENGKVKEIIPYTSQARAASQEFYQRIFNA